MLENLKNIILNLNLDDNSVLFNGDNIAILANNSIYNICKDKIKHINIIDDEKRESIYYSKSFIEALNWSQINKIYATSDAYIIISGTKYYFIIENNSIFIYSNKDNKKILILALDDTPLKNQSEFIIGPQAFRYATNLSSICISSDNIKIDIQSFSIISSLQSVDLSKLHIKQIPQEMFEDDISLTNVILPSSLTSIGACAFRKCSLLSSIEIPQFVIMLEHNCFQYSGLVSIEIPCNINIFGGHIFNNCEKLSTIICHQLSILQSINYSLTNQLSIYVNKNQYQQYIDDMKNNQYEQYIQNIISYS